MADTERSRPTSASGRRRRSAGRSRLPRTRPGVGARSTGGSSRRSTACGGCRAPLGCPYEEPLLRAPDTPGVGESGGAEYPTGRLDRHQCTVDELLHGASLQRDRSTGGVDLHGHERNPVDRHRCLEPVPQRSVGRVARGRTRRGVDGAFMPGAGPTGAVLGRGLHCPDQVRLLVADEADLLQRRAVDAWRANRSAAG